MSLYTILLFAGQCLATPLGSFFFDKDGKSKWIAASVHPAGFPTRIPLLFNLTLQNMQNQQISSQMIFLQNQTKTFHHSFLVPSFWLNDYSDGFSVCLWTFMSSSFHFCSSMCIPIRLQCRIHFLPQFPKVHCIDIKLHI